VSDLTPVGSAASISGAWAIDGVPPSASGCATLGANLVRVVFVDELRAVAHGGLVFACDVPCEASCFDTRPNAVVAEGDWTVRLEALRGSEVVAASSTTPVSTADGHIELERVRFWSGAVEASFAIEGAPPTYESCERAGIAFVELVFDAAGGEVASAAREACSVGGVGSRVEPDARYSAHLRAVDASGGVVRESAVETFDVSVGERHRLDGGARIELGGP
jgi:hypothetical protein